MDVSEVLFGRGWVSKKESLGRNATLKTRKSAPESLGPRWKTKLSYKLWGFKVDMMMQLSFIAAQRRNPKKCQRALQSGTLLLHDVVTSGLLKSTLYRSLKEMSKSYNHQDPLGNQHPSNQTLQSLEQVFSPPMVFFVLVYWGVCSGWMRILLISCTGSWLLQNIPKPGFYVFFPNKIPLNWRNWVQPFGFFSNCNNCRMFSPKQLWWRKIWAVTLPRSGNEIVVS